jgi:hypothetical protein
MPDPSDHWNDEFTHLLTKERQRVEQFLAAQRSRIDRIAAELAARDLESEQRLAATAQDGHSPDWHVQKRRLLATFDAEVDPAGEQAAAYRAEIEELILATDHALRQKDLEVEEIKRLLSEESEKVSRFTAEAAKQNELFDHDAVIVQERANLRQLQEQYQKKLREAEIEISQERAKLARDQSELAENLRACQSQADQQTADIAAADAHGAQPHGRWLARLGLADGGEDDKATR